MTSKQIATLQRVRNAIDELLAESKPISKPARRRDPLKEYVELVHNTGKRIKPNFLEKTKKKGD